MSMIQDGTGSGALARVSTTKRLFTNAVTETQTLHSVEKGDGYNINTGVISLTGTSDSAVMYLKNNETRDLVVDAIAVGLGAGTQSDPCKITIIRNPTTGTLIDGASAVDMNANRNFGSSKSLTVDVYKGADGNTLTDGADFGILFANQNSRLFADLGIIIPKGNSIGVKIDPNLTTGSINIYAALIVHLQESELKD